MATKNENQKPTESGDFPSDETIKKTEEEIKKNTPRK